MTRRGSGKQVASTRRGSGKQVVMTRRGSEKRVTSTRRGSGKQSSLAANETESSFEGNIVQLQRKQIPASNKNRFQL